MVDLFARSKTPEIVQNAAWAISNLARGANTPGLPFIDCGIVEPLMDKLNSGRYNKFKATTSTAITLTDN